MNAIKNIRAFTLMEIMVVILIIGVMAGFAIPRYNNAVERVRSREGVQILTALLGAQRRFALGDPNGNYAGSGAALADGDLDIDIPAPDNFNVPIIKNDSDAVASITRPNLYTLTINDQAVISCAPQTGIGGFDWCPTLGYP